MRIKLPRGRYVLGAWMAFSREMIRVFTVYAYEHAWVGTMTIQRAGGRKTTQCTIDGDEEFVERLSISLMEAYMADDKLPRMIYVEVKSNVPEIAKRRLRVLPWTTVEVGQ